MKTQRNPMFDQRKARRGWDLPRACGDWAAWVGAVVGGSVLIALTANLVAGAVSLVIGVALFGYRWHKERHRHGEPGDAGAE